MPDRGPPAPAACRNCVRPACRPARPERRSSPFHHVLAEDQAAVGHPRRGQCPPLGQPLGLVGDDEALDQHALADDETKIGTGRELGIVVLRDHAAHRDPRERVEQVEYGRLHARRRHSRNRRRSRSGTRPPVRGADRASGDRRSRRSPRLSCTQRHFSEPPAMPTTRAPARLASCPATEPTAPDAAEITTVSPFFGWQISVMPR